MCKTLTGKARRDLGVLGSQLLGAVIVAGAEVKLTEFRAAPGYPPSDKYLQIAEGSWKSLIVDRSDFDLAELGNGIV